MKRMSEERIILEISVPRTKPDPNWKGWDLETFELREHLANLINAYGIGILKEELNECEEQGIRTRKFYSRPVSGDNRYSVAKGNDGTFFLALFCGEPIGYSKHYGKVCRSCDDHNVARIGAS